MRSGIKLVFGTLPLILLGGAFIAFTIVTKPAPAQVESSERAVAVRFITAVKASVAPQASGFGLVAPARTYEAIAQVTGTAEYVNPLLKRGEILPKGALLIRLADSDYTLAIAQANANIRSAQARLAEIDISQTNLEAALDIEKETFALKLKEMERLEKLFDAGTASQAARDGAKATYLAQNQKVQSLQSSLALLPTQRQVQTEQISVYQATLETAKLNLGRTELRLPFPARVGAVSVEIGQLVRSGQTIAAFDGIKTAEVEALIPAADMQRLSKRHGDTVTSFAMNSAALTDTFAQLGITATVRLRLGQQFIEWPAVLDRISNTIDPKTGTIGVIVRIENAYASAKLGTRPPLTKGMFVEVTLEAKPVDGIIIPRTALRQGKVLLADQDSRLNIISVTADLIQGDIALIMNDIKETAKIVVSSPVPLMQGMLLDLHPDVELMHALAASGSSE